MCEQSRMIHDFFSRSKVKLWYTGTSIARLIDTRWTGYQKYAVSIYNNYEELVAALTTLQTTDKKTSGLKSVDLALAHGIFRAPTTHFVFMLLAMKIILKTVQPADTVLQATTTGYREALLLICSFMGSIVKKRTGEDFESQSRSMLPAHVDSRPIRNRRRATQLKDFVVLDTIGESIGELYEKEVLKASYFDIIDFILQEMQSRFNDNNDILLSLSAAEEFDLEALKVLGSCGVIMLNIHQREVAKEYTVKNRKEGSIVLATLHP